MFIQSDLGWKFWSGKCTFLALLEYSACIEHAQKLYDFFSHTLALFTYHTCFDANKIIYSVEIKNLHTCLRKFSIFINFPGNSITFSNIIRKLTVNMHHRLTLLLILINHTMMSLIEFVSYRITTCFPNMHLI